MTVTNMFKEIIENGLADGSSGHCDCPLCDGAGSLSSRPSDFKNPRPQVKKCPECRDGKHMNCDGIADLDDNDQPVPCACDSEEPHPMRVDLIDFDEDDDSDGD